MPRATIARLDRILDDLNPEQREAVCHGEGPLLVVAGAGSGKTRVITRRIARIVGQGVVPWHVLALTFTNKAAREMRERVLDLVPGAARDLWVSTFHSYAARVLRRYAERVGFTAEFSIYDGDDRQQLLKTILKELSFDDLRPQEVAHQISRRKNGMGRSDPPGPRGARLAQVMRLYDERMVASNAMDFDDLLLRLKGLLESDDEARSRLRERARWLLVDEYQDTNDVQYAILRLLAGESRNVCATGDPDQSIYRWRGATLRNILDFERDFPGARRVTLDRNYRSTRSILAVANAVIRHNRGRLEKDLRTDNADGMRPREIRCLDEGDEAQAAAALARAWIAAGHRPGQIAIFYRINAQSRTLERAMAESATPYRIVGAVEFYRRKEVKDLLAYVRLARNPSDDGAFRRIFNVPARGLGKTTEERFFAEAASRGIPARALLRETAGGAGGGRARKALSVLAALLDGFEALPPEEPGVFVEAIVQRTAYKESLGGEGDPGEVDRAGNVDELVNAAYEFGLRNPEGGIDGFLQENALVSDQDTYDERADAVSLMTVHSAKGLEFPCVAVTGLEEGLFPHAFSMGERDEIEEERRLFYVAVTRAEEHLALLHARTRMRQGVPQRNLPSRFLDEIPDEALEVEERGFVPRGPAGHVEEAEAVFQREDPQAALREGDPVRHHHFGRGKVLAVRKSGGATRVTVDFLDSGRRELSLEYARLTRLRNLSD